MCEFSVMSLGIRLTSAVAMPLSPKGPPHLSRPLAPPRRPPLSSQPGQLTHNGTGHCGCLALRDAWDEEMQCAPWRSKQAFARRPISRSHPIIKG